MSLDVYLRGPEETHKCECRHCGNEHERKEKAEYYWSNITHNLGKMAGEAGIYEALWRPDEQGWRRASDLIAPLRAGLEDLINRPEYFRQFNAPNGWGKYESLVTFVKNYLAACEEYPDAEVHVSR